MKDMLLWIDTETTGLNYDTDLLLEVGLALSTKEGKIEAEQNWIITAEEYGGIDEIKEACTKELNDGTFDKFTLEMHTDNGLFMDIQSDKAISTFKAITEIQNWFTKHDIPVGKLPMSGNNPQFDRNFLREFMPQVEKNFHYRNIDVSSIKELCQMHNPRIFEEWIKTQPEVQAKKHRVLPDIEDSIAEYLFYCDNFLYTV